MNKYVVAYTQESENDISQAIVEATSDRDAIIKYLATFQDITFTETELLSMEDVDLLTEYCLSYMAASVAVVQI